MSHQDDKDVRTDCQALKEVLEFLLPREELEGIERHGNAKFAPFVLAASTGSERHLAREMLEQLPADARVVGDAEYVGYPLWSAVIASRRWFVILVGPNIQLLKKLGYVRQRRDLVYYWPDASLREGQAPLVLKLIQVTKVGRHPIWLVTNEQTLSEEQLREVYKARWGIEVSFRTVKQNCQKAKLLCRIPEHVEIELNWTLLGIWAALFIAKLKICLSGGDPDRVSPVRVVDAFARALCTVVYAGCRNSRLSDALAAALRADESQRTSKKTSRDYPKKKKHRPCGQPIIRPATPAQVQAAKALIQC